MCQITLTGILPRARLLGRDEAGRHVRLALDRVAVEEVARRVLDVDEDRVVLLRPAALRLAAVVVGPDQLVEEALAAEHLVEQQLDVVRLAVVEVQVQRAGGVQHAAQLAQPRLEEAEVVVERVAVGGRLEQRGGVAAAAEAGAVAVGGRDRGQRAARLRAAGVERRVGVDQLHAAVLELAQQRQVVAEHDPLHGGASLSAPAWQAATSSRCAMAALRTTPASRRGGPTGVRAYRRRARDRPRRAAHHHPPPVAGRSTTRCPTEPVRVGSIVRVPFGRQALDGVVVGLAERSRAAAPSGWSRRPACARTTCPPTSSSWRCGWRTEYCSTPARALSLVLPPRGRPRTELWARRTDAPLDGRAADRPPARAARRACRRAAAGDLARAAAARGARAGGDRAAPAPPRAAHRRRSRSAPVELTPEQAAAVAAVEAGGAHLLHGVTGSGKTEVYLRAAAAALERGEGVIVLVPEIALTPQTVGRFQARFGDTVALLHSALGEGERYDEWRRLRTGEARIAVGPRSAVFAPVADLGLVVIDEEHDASYKHEGDPRYDARTVAAERVRRARRARLLVGSATPRPGDVARAAAAAAARPGRLAAAAARAGARHARRPPPAAPRDAARAGERAQVDRAAQPPRLVELPHLPQLREGRGSARSATSRSSCTAPSTRSRATTAATASGCPSAATRAARSSVARHGAGTERIEHELREGLDVPVFRLDADTAGAKDAVPELLARFRAAPDGAAARHADGRQGPRLPGRHARRGARRRQHAALPRLPRRGAHVRADRPARRARRARAARRPRARADQRARTRRRSPPPPATTPRGSWPASWSAAARSATRRSRT